MFQHRSLQRTPYFPFSTSRRCSSLLFPSPPLSLFRSFRFVSFIDRIGFDWVICVGCRFPPLSSVSQNFPSRRDFFAKRATGLPVLRNCATRHQDRLTTTWTVLLSRSMTVSSIRFSFPCVDAPTHGWSNQECGPSAHDQVFQLWYAGRDHGHGRA